MGDTLGTFEGRDVVRSSIAVTNAGDGLSEAMGVDPVELHLGDRVFVALECVVSKVRYEPLKDTDVLTRVHHLRAGTGTIIDGAVVEKFLDEQRDAIERAKDQLSGQTRIEHELRSAHVLGEHADEMAVHCPLCEEEREAAALEATEANA